MAHLGPALAALGAYGPADLQDLEDEDLGALHLRPLELRRFLRARKEFFSEQVTAHCCPPKTHPSLSFRGGGAFHLLHASIRYGLYRLSPPSS